jgi:hypothetical protein
MGLQIWHTEDIENILWGMHAVMLATITASESSDRSVDCSRGFKQGFEAALQCVTISCNERLLPQGIGFRQDIAEILLAVQAVMLAGVTTSEDTDQSVDYSRSVNQGLETALWCIATSFGISLLSPTNDSLPVRESSVYKSFWFREDIDNILLTFRAVIWAAVAASKDKGRLSDYNQGFEDALRCVAKSLGVRLLPKSGPWLGEAALSSANHSWLREDIEKDLLTVYRTKKATMSASENSGKLTDYDQGFETALQCIGRAFGSSL